MSTFYAVLCNNYKRTIPKIGSIIVITFISLTSIVLAVYMTNNKQTFANIAVIGQVDESSYMAAGQILNISFLAQEPPISDLYEQKYDAYLTTVSTGDYEIKSLKSEEYKNTILELLKNPAATIPSSYKGRSTGENIIGFMMMFLLMISFSNMFAFADDKEQGQMKRVFSTPASFVGYISAHIVYSLSMFLPQFLLVVVLRLLDISVGFSIPEYLGLIVMIGFLGSSFALLLNTLIKKPDNANMLGNAVTVLSSILAGTFYSFSKENKIVDSFIGLIPQKQIMNIAADLGHMDFNTVGSLVYVLAFSLVLFIISCGILSQTTTKRNVPYDSFLPLLNVNKSQNAKTKRM